MTHRAETRFICDRCAGEEVVQSANGPVHVRSGGPEGWLALAIGNDPNQPVRHICPSCNKQFKLWLGNHKEGP